DNLVNAGDGGDGVDAENNPALNAGRGGWGGWAQGGAVWCGPGSTPKLINCIIENNVAQGGDGGDGGDYDAQGGSANYGGNWSRSQAIHYDPCSANIEFVTGDLWETWKWDFAGTYGPIYGEPNLTSYLGDYRLYSAYGGGVYCDRGSHVTFENCQIRGNSTQGGMSGIGGVASGAGRILEPVVSFEMPTYGAGVYCAADTRVTFKDCSFENNVASGVIAGVDPNHRLDPYVGYGGGVAAEKSAAITFMDCNFVDNEADSGGGVYISTTEATILDCNIISNTALRGAGFLGVNASVDMLSSRILNNLAIADPNDPNNGVEDILASGGGLYCWQGGINIQDCNVAGNRADFSGGGVYLRDISGASFVNNLITGNLASRDGGGVSANWYTSLAVSNCTISGNAVIDNIGEPNDASFGGGLYCSYESNCVIADSIFWDNFAETGNAIVVGTGFEYDRRPATLSISHSNVQNGQAGVFVEEGCTLNWGQGNINEEPLFTEGPLGDYYLSQTEAGQAVTSPCVDAGSDYATSTGMWHYTTRTDEVSDAGLADMGFHHPVTHPCKLCDLAFDGVIDFADYARVAEAWLEDSCSKENAWCQGADLTSDTRVDFRDILFLADCWLVFDATPPMPDPSRWETEPYLSSGSSISMTAETAFDAWGWDVEYYFDCIDDAGCHDSGWQTSPTYTDSGLTPDVSYGYRTRTRDGVQWIPDDGTDELGNKTEWSEIRYAGPDNIPPAPAPFIETIFAASPVAVTMVSTTAYDDSGVEYYFENTVGNGNDSGWVTDPNYTDVGLDPNTEYGYRVRARDNSAAQNTTPWSDTVLVTTPGLADTIPPVPNPMEWDPTVDPNGFDGTPREIVIDPNALFGYGATMLATVAVDAGGGPVEYFFECTTESGFSSGWIATPDYTVLVGRIGQGHRFRVKARDQWGNETAWSTEEVAN
ncbi:right-handed parallel beta-helix repeat-containing protein, partial [Planctomycetota bacterium]